MSQDALLSRPNGINPMETTMSERLNFHATAPEAVKAMLAVSHYVSHSSIEHSLAELVKHKSVR